VLKNGARSAINPLNLLPQFCFKQELNFAKFGTPFYFAHLLKTFLPN
jgi:hypothetical protein